MRKLLLLSVFLLACAVSHAADSYTGIFVYVDGESIGYLFEQMPTVTYSTESDEVKVAQLSVDGNSSPVLSLRLTEDAKLVVEYGEVLISEGVESPASTAKVQKDGKYFICGKLVIIKNGKKYNVGGNPVK